jgi:hypothetical protein
MISARYGSTLLLVAATASCGGSVNEPGPQSGAGGGSSGSPPATSVASSSGAGGAGAGAGGADTVLGEPDCQLDEGALVMATSSTSARIAVQYEGEWVTDGAVLPPAARIATYVDAYHQLGAFWIDPAGESSSAHFVTTFDGLDFEARDVTGWAPLPSAPLFAPGGGVLVGGVEAGTNVAFFDPDASDWHSFVEPISFAATSAAAAPAIDALMLVGIGSSHQLCYVSLVAGAWQPIHCHPNIDVATGGEIPLTRPQVVALPDGDLVVIHYPSTNELAATTLHDGTWSTPVSITSDAIGVAFAAAATPEGDVVAGLISTSGDVFALRYSRSSGWGEPVAVDGGALAQQQLAAAMGICGDDVLIAYASATGGQIRVARVRGNAAGAFSVAELAGEQPDQLSIVTRPPGGE